MRRVPRVASLRLVLEDRRVDELLARLKELDLALVETEDKLGRLTDRLEVLAVKVRNLESQPGLPFARPEVHGDNLD